MCASPIVHHGAGKGGIVELRVLIFCCCSRIFQDARIARELREYEEEVEREVQAKGLGAWANQDMDTLAADAMEMADEMHRENSEAIEEEDIIIAEAVPEGNQDLPMYSVSPGTGAVIEPGSVPPQVSPSSIPPGLLFYDGKDAQGRTVVVLRTGSMPETYSGRSAALAEMKEVLTPIVEEPYVLLLITAENGYRSYNPMWLLSSFRALGRPFKKNVQYVLFHKPSYFVRSVLAMTKAFVSAKASKKWRTLKSLEELGEKTEGDVTMGSLGSATQHLSGL